MIIVILLNFNCITHFLRLLVFASSLTQFSISGFILIVEVWWMVTDEPITKMSEFQGKLPKTVEYSKMA